MGAARKAAVAATHTFAVKSFTTATLVLITFGEIWSLEAAMFIPIAMRLFCGGRELGSATRDNPIAIIINKVNHGSDNELKTPHILDSC